MRCCRACLAVAALALAACAPTISTTTPAPAAPAAVESEPVTPETAEPEAEVLHGEALARARCSSCHAFPPPEILTKQGWRPVHMHMIARVGLAEDFLGNPPPWFGDVEREGVTYFRDKLEGLNLVPTPPLIPRHEFLEIRDFLIDRAPVRPLPQAPKTAVQTGPTPFRLGPRIPFDPAVHVAVTLVAIDEERGVVFAGGEKDWDPAIQRRPAYLQVMDGRGRVLDGMQVNSAPVSISRAGRDYLLTTVGSLATVQSSRARLIRVVLRDGDLKATELLDRQFRAAGAAVHPMPDGSRLVALNGFGYYVGELTLFRERNGRIVSRQTLLDEPGAMVSRFGDFDRDGWVDLVCLFSQHHESVLLFQDVESGLYEPVELLKKFPAWGLSSIDFADLNGDGVLDLLTSNGDNSDYPDAPLKNYHGIRIHVNTATGEGEIPRYEERFFRPVHGAYKVLARDFDLDGDIDLAVLGRYLDESVSPRENFLYMENRSSAGGAEFSFRTSVLPELEASDLVTMDAGDLDGDGDLDLVLGSSIPLGPKRPSRETPFGVVYLINGTR